MSLGLAANTALTGLRTNQSVLNVLSQNIANSNTEDYSRQVANLEALTIEGRGAGVNIASITRNIDIYLQRALQGQVSNVGQAEVISDYMDRIQLILGEPAAGLSLNAKVDNFFTGLQDLADNPERASIRETLVATADSLSRDVSSLALQLEDLRYEADQDVSRAVNFLNQKFQELYDVNTALGSATIFGQNKSGLLDERDALLEDIADYLDIRVLYQADDQAFVSANGGVALVDYDLHKLFYSPSNSIAAFTGNSTQAAIEVGVVDGRTGVEISSTRETLVEASTEGSVDTDMRSGRLLGILEMRDVIIPEMLQTLDEFAQTLRDQVNAIHNEGAGFPPLSQLTGQLYVDPAEVREWSGAPRIAVVNADGSPILNPQDTVSIIAHERGGFRPLTLNLDFDSGEGQINQHSHQTIVDEINAYFGPQTTKTQVLNMSDIKLVSMVENPGPAVAGDTFTFDFDLENITAEQSNIQVTGLAVVGAVAASETFTGGSINVDPGERFRTGAGYTVGFDWDGVTAPVQIQVTADVTNTVTAQVETVTLEYTFDPTTQNNIRNDRFTAAIISAPSPFANVLTPVNGSPIARASLVDAQGNTVSAGQPGFLRIEALNSDQYIVMDENGSSDQGRLFATPPETGTQRGFSHYYGLNNFFNENDNRLQGNTDDDFLNSALDLGVRSDILASPSLVSAGKLVAQNQPADPNDGPLYTFEHNVGNKAIAQKLADLGLSQVAFDDAGLLATTTQTLSDYISSTIGAMSSQAKFATLSFEQSTFLFEGMEDRQNSISGVNLDEELANTVLYQNAYGATARVISIIGEMFETLLTISG